MPHMARIDPFTSSTMPPIPNMERLFFNSSPDYDWANGMRKLSVRPIGDTPSAYPQPSYRDRHQRLRELENDKNSLIEDLIHQLECTERELNQLKLDYDRDSRFNREGHLREESMRNEIESYRAMLAQETYATVLIDADTAVFVKELWSKGEAGGIEAANLIKQKITEHIAERVPGLASHQRLHVRLFADLRRLASNLLKSKLIDKHSVFDDFIRTMNSQPSVDFVDSGNVPGFTRAKIIENYLSNISNCHCHQIYLAMAYHQDYDCILANFKDASISHRVTYIQTLSKSSEEIADTLRSTRLEDVFLDKLPELSSKAPPTKVAGPPGLSRVESNTSIRTGGSGSGSTSSTPALTWAAMTAQPFIPSASSSTARVLSNVSVPDSNTPPLPQSVAANIPHNRHGQRIDAQDNSIPYQELQRIKKMKLCNTFYLQGPTACSGSCSHSHTYPLKAYEKNVLREVARMTPCYYKLECLDANCIYGHRCPQSKPGQETCYYGDKCRFDGWGHGIDVKIVKIMNGTG